MTDIEQLDGVSRPSVSISSGGTFSKVLSARGARGISGIVDKPSGFKIELEWLSPDETVIATETVTTGASGVTEFSEDWHTVDKCRIKVTDTSSTAEDAGITVSVV
jgi:hypothetical protein